MKIYQRIAQLIIESRKTVLESDRADRDAHILMTSAQHPHVSDLGVDLGSSTLTFFEITGLTLPVGDFAEEPFGIGIRPILTERQISVSVPNCILTPEERVALQDSLYEWLTSEHQTC